MNNIYYCENCEDKRSYKAISKHIYNREEPHCEYTFAYCETCSRPSLFVREDYRTENGFNDDAYYKVFPANQRNLGFVLPEMVRKSYEEAVKCELSKIPTACVVMVGRALEAVIKMHLPSTSTIFKGLEELKKTGVISQELFDWSQRLRALRNAGAHASSIEISQPEASEALDFLQAILEILYHLRPKFKSISERGTTSP